MAFNLLYSKEFDDENEKTHTFLDKKKGYYLTILKKRGQTRYMCDCMACTMRPKKECKHLKECLDILGKKSLSEI